MTSPDPLDRWEEIQALFHRFADVPPDEREEGLRGACDDPTAVAEVLAMLAEDRRGASLLERGVEGVAGDLLETGGAPPAIFGPYRVLGLLGEGGGPGSGSSRDSPPAVRGRGT
jgi:hypothetical protein